MRRFATLALSLLVLAPAVAAQTRPLTGFYDDALTFDLTADAPTRATFSSEEASLAPGDTTFLTNIPEGTTQISTFSSGANYLFGTGSEAFDIAEFGAAYTIPSGPVYEVIGATLFVTVPPDEGGTGETFEVRVYEGTVAGGPTGDPVYSEVFSADIVPKDLSGGVPPTVTFFAEPVTVSTPVFFVTYTTDGITSQFGAGSTNILDVDTPETQVLRAGSWSPVFEEFVTDGEPLTIQLFAEALIREFDPDGNVLTLADARAAGDGETVTVQGTVTRAEGDFTYLQDETGGLVIRQTSGAFFDEVAAGTIFPGRTLRVTGTLSEFNGLLQINGGALESYEERGGAEVPAPQPVTLAELATNGEAYEGELVLVTDVTFADLDAGAAFTAATTYQVTDPTDATNTVTVRVPNAEDTTIDGTIFQGDPARVTGVVGQFSSTAPDAGYQILLVRERDVLPNAVAVGESPDGRLALSGLVPNPSTEAAVVTVSLATAGPATLTVVDVLGREVARVLDGALAAGDHPVRLDVSGLPAGTYLVRLVAQGATVVQPFTVAR